MSKFSLINISSKRQNKINGYWLQDHIGTLETAKQVAKETKKANSNKIDIAIILEVINTTPILDYFTDREFLAII